MSKAFKREPVAANSAIRVLLLEDNPLDAELSLQALRRESIVAQVEVVKTSEEFAGKLRKSSYDIVLADYHLPNWTGMAALEMIQTLGLNLPLILVTGTLGEERAVECIKLGVTDYVLKDQLARLPMAVRRALEEKALREERARSLTDLEESASNFRFLFAKNPIPMMVFDRETQHCLEVNEAAVRQYGYSREEFLMLRTANICTPDGAEQLTKYLVKDLRELTNAGIWHHVTKDGRTIDVEIMVHEMEFQGRAARLIAALNVTEKRALESQLRQAQKFEAIGQLAGGIAHDFNNMIGAILGWAELGSEEALPESRLHGYFQKVRQQAIRAAELTKQLLAFARRQVLEPRNMDLNKSVREVTSLLGKVIGNEIELAKILGDDVPVVKADPTQVEQVIMNLCMNARDAMPHGGRVQIVTAREGIDLKYCDSHRYASPGVYARLTVSDTGIGMDAGTLERIFEPFFTTKEVGKGTGLGLAMIYGIVKQHGGFVQVESELGKGARFDVYWPASKTPSAAEQKSSAAEPVRGGKEMVLIAEDHEGLREIARETLASLGYRTEIARDGEEAVRQFLEHRDEIGLVLLDVGLPKLKGTEVYGQICKMRPDVPVLFVTGYSADSEMQRLAQEKGLSVLQKPYGPHDLAQRVRAALDHVRKNISAVK